MLFKKLLGTFCLIILFSLQIAYTHFKSEIKSLLLHFQILFSVCLFLCSFLLLVLLYICLYFSAQKIKFSIKDFFSKCDQMRSFLGIWSDLLKKSLMEKTSFFVQYLQNVYIVTSQNLIIFLLLINHKILTLPAPIPDKERKLTTIFIFTLLFGASKDFMKVLKAF